MYTIIVVLVLCYHRATSQPVSNELWKRVGQLGECCPCPSAGDQLSLVSDGTLADGRTLTRANVDDCPCGPRAADSEGASSLFFPSAIRPDGLNMRPTDQKEDKKNLLEPEVTLATSMLDTLREATEEEYRDALEREAARNEAESDAVPEESARNVVIIVSPEDSDIDDDFISEASHVQESRCIHPFDSTSLNRMRSSTNSFNVLPDTFKLPKLNRPQLSHKNSLHSDGNLGASNVDESIIDINGNSRSVSSEVSEFKQTNSPISLFSGHDLLKIIKPNKKYGLNNENDSNENTMLPLLPNLKSGTNLGIESFSPESKSNHLAAPIGEETSQLFKYDKIPLNMRNLLKLRDVELIPNTIRSKSLAKPKFNISQFTIPKLFNKNKITLSKNCNDAQSENNQVLKSSNKDTNIKEMNTDASENIISLNNLEKSKDNSSLPELNKSLEITEKDNNDIINDFVEDKYTDFNTFSSLLEVQSEINGNDVKKDLKVSELPNGIIDCNIPNEPLTKKGIENISREVISDGYDENKDKKSSQDQNMNADQNSDSSSTILNILRESQEKSSQEAIKNEGIFLCDTEREAGNKEVPIPFIKALENKNVVPTLGETLSNLRHNVVNQFGNIKKSSVKSGLFKIPVDGGNVDDKSGKSISDRDSSISSLNNEVTETSTDYNTAISSNFSDKYNKDDISMDDLQNMSDKLLNFNNKKKSENSFLNEDISNTGINTFFSNGSQIDKETNSESSEMKLNSVKIDETSIKNSENTEKTSCLNDAQNENTEIRKESTPTTQKLEKKEMETSASEHIIKTLPNIFDALNPNFKLRSPISEDVVLQPSIDRLNLLGKPLGNVLNLNTNLATLDDLRERLTNIFNSNDESSDDYLSSLEADFTNDSPLETMVPDASTRNSLKESPLLRQLEDFNNDIIRNSPFDSLARNQKPQLHSYRAHLPSPTSLDVKPFKIESKLRELGKNKAEIKRPLTNFGADRFLPRKAKPMRPLAKPLKSFDTLEELQNALRLNSNSLLYSPLLPEISSVSEKIRSNDIEDVAKNIKLNTEKTFKGIQRKMKSSLKKQSIQNPIDSFAKPQDLLDDMTDKIKGIHYDLNDRLSSFRENILGPARIKSLLGEPREAANKNVMKNYKKNKPKSASASQQTAASITTVEKINPQQYSENQNEFVSLQPNNYISTDWNKLRNSQSKSESSATPATIEKLKPTEPSFAYFHKTLPSFRHSPVRTDILTERIPFVHIDPKQVIDNKRPHLKSAVSPLVSQRQPKVKISFETTTPPSNILLPRPVVRVPNVSKSQFENHNPRTSPSTSNEVFEGHSAAYARNSPLKLNPVRTSALAPSPSNEDFEDTLNNFSNEESSRDVLFKSPAYRDMTRANTQTLPNTIKIPNPKHIFQGTRDNFGSKSVLKSLNWPIVTENSVILGKSKTLTDDSKPVNGVRNEQLDMLRSPSENTDIAIIEEPLKENVSYRCRLVCTKEIR